MLGAGLGAGLFECWARDCALGLRGAGNAGIRLRLVMVGYRLSRLSDDGIWVVSVRICEGRERRDGFS
jgi:hypothetical protein